MRVYSYPPATIQVPCAICAFPESLDYNRTYGPVGADEAMVPVLVVVSKVFERGAQKKLKKFCARSGDSSIKAALEAFTYTESDIVHVNGVTIDVYTINEIDYLAATFQVQVVATG